MEFKVGDRVRFIGGKDLVEHGGINIGKLGTVMRLPHDTDGVMLSVVFDDNPGHEALWYPHRFELVSQELKTAYNTTTVVEACAEVKKISDIVTSLQQDLQEINDLAPGYVSIGVGSDHFRLGNLDETLHNELKTLLHKARSRNLEEASQILEEKIRNLQEVLTNAG